MKKGYVLVLLFLPFFVGMLGANGRAYDAGRLSYPLTLTSENPTMWADGQWRFYTCDVGYHDTITVNITYNAYLNVTVNGVVTSVPDPVPMDLDMRLFLDLTAKPWDITREGIDKVPLTSMQDNSQNRTGNVEEVRYYNDRYNEGMKVYVLIFIYSGTGNANITLHTNHALTLDQPRIGGFQGWVLDNMLIVVSAFMLAMVGLILVMNHYRKNYKRYIQEQKDKTAKEKLGPRSTV